jgi:response regulator NasT
MTDSVDLQQGLRVAIADDDPDILELLKQTLNVLGHRVLFTATTGRSLVEQAKRHEPDLVIADIKMPDMDGLDAASAIYEHRPTPIILISGYSDRDYIRRAQESHILAYLVKPVAQAELEPAISLAMRRFTEFVSLQREAADLRQALSDRRLIEKAKGILMKHLNLDEQEAFRRLQHLASSRRIKLVQVAESIVTAAEAFGT